MNNCFDMACPKCGHSDMIDVEARVWVRLTHDGTDADLSGYGDHEWEQTAKATCQACGYAGAAMDFDPPGVR